jgi:hypothetical protein
MLPTPAVMAIAAAPQNNTWAVPRSFGAPPTWAPKAPRPARQIKVVITTVGIILSLGAKMAAASGSDAATVNVSPEAIAACNGFAACTSDTPPYMGGYSNEWNGSQSSYPDVKNAGAAKGQYGGA